MNESTKLLALINGYKISHAFFIAAEYRLFDDMDGITNLHTIAGIAGIDAGALHIMLKLFSTIGLIEEKQPQCYKLKEEYKKFLRSDSETSYMPLARLESYLSGCHTSKKTMEDVVVNGAGRDLFNENSKENKAGIYGQAMDSGGKFSSMCIARELISLEGGTILDAGGGVGTNSIQVCKMNQSIDAVILDKKEMEAACLDNRNRHGLQERIRFRAADLRTDVVEGRYHGIIMSNILHLFDDEVNKQILAKLTASLEQGGLIVFHDFFIGGGTSQQFIASVYSMDWMMHGSFFCLRPDELRVWVEPFGLEVVKVKHYDNIPTSIIVAKKR